MSALWPHPPYAEDQPHHHAILTTHVLHRGFQAGSILGSLSGVLSYTYASLLKKPQTVSPPPPSHINPSSVIGASAAKGIGASAATGIGTRSLFMPTVLRAAATGGVLGTALMALMLPARMRGREEIEWRDRSWRLLENRGQVEVDSFGVVGAVLGAVGAWQATSGTSVGGKGAGGMLGNGKVDVGEMAERGLRGLRATWRGFVRGRGGMVLGGAGVGASLGVLAYLGWRYGVNGGKWAEAVEEGVESGARGVGVVRR